MISASETLPQKNNGHCRKQAENTWPWHELSSVLGCGSERVKDVHTAGRWMSYRIHELQQCSMT